MKPGDTIWVRTAKADGQPHRWWQAQVEAVDGTCVVVYAPAGSPVYHNAQRFPAGLFHLEHIIRAYYCSGRRHTLLEIYDPDGALVELYADITSPIEIDAGEIRYIDHELDVSQLTGDVGRIVDQDEFAAAAEAYGYTAAFMGECYALAEALVAVLATWPPRGATYAPGEPADCL